MVKVYLKSGTVVQGRYHISGQKVLVEDETGEGYRVYPGPQVERIESTNRDGLTMPSNWFDPPVNVRGPRKKKEGATVAPPILTERPSGGHDEEWQDNGR